MKKSFFLVLLVSVALSIALSRPTHAHHPGDMMIEAGDQTRTYSESIGVHLGDDEPIFLIALEYRGIKGKFPCLLSKALEHLKCKDARFFVINSQVNLSRKGIPGFMINLTPVSQSYIATQMGIGLKLVPMEIGKDIHVGVQESIKVNTFEITGMKMWGEGHHENHDHDDVENVSGVLHDHNHPAVHQSVHHPRSRFTAMIHAAVSMIGYRYLSFVERVEQEHTGDEHSHMEAHSPEEAFSGFSIAGATLGGQVKWNMTQTFSLQLSVMGSLSENINSDRKSLVDYHVASRLEAIFERAFHNHMDFSLFAETGNHGYSLEEKVGHDYLLIGITAKH